MDPAKTQTEEEKIEASEKDWLSMHHPQKNSISALTFFSLVLFWASSQPHLGHTAGLCLFLYI